MTDEISIDVATDADWDALTRATSLAFNADVDESTSGSERLTFEPERFLVARRDGEIVGTAGIYTRGLAVPGAVVAAGHVTYISVAATARRQGVLTRFMHRQFDDMRAAGEPIAVLWASEGRIYQRFGYGLAAQKLSFDAESREMRLNAGVEGTGRLREGTVDELRDTMLKVYDEVFAHRPGWSQRATQHMQSRLTDHEDQRRGASRYRVLVHEGSDGVDGYTLWRSAPKWDQRGPRGEVRIEEMCSATDEAYTAMWRFLLSVDLTRTVTTRFASVDEPIQFMVDEPRRLNASLADALWVRVLDVPAALIARRYAADVDVVLDVTDPIIASNQGRWRLRSSGGSVECESTVDGADLAIQVRALGAAYLGGASLGALAGAGLVTELRGGALARASAAFGWHRLPSAREIF